MEGDSSINISGRVSGGSGRGSCGGTSIYNGNYSTAGEFITGATTTESATTVLAVVSVSLSNTNVKKTADTPFPSCDVSLWDSGLGGGG